MKIAVADIGSNAARIEITSILDNQTKKLEYIRFPLQLGKDVFISGKISKEKELNFLKLMKIFKYLMELYKVDTYLAYATSALRDAQNNQEVLDFIENETNIKIEIISGEKEAELINNVIVKIIDNEPHLHIDVGGGSTELNYYNFGKKVLSESFNIGTVRSSINDKTNLERIRMKEWIKNITLNQEVETSLGTGGNIRKLFELSGIKDDKILTVKKIKELKEKIESYSIHDLVHILLLNEDRAEVIVPAIDIYLSCMKWAESKRIRVPEVGLKDGMILEILEKMKFQKINRF